MNLFAQYKGLRRGIYILFIGRVVTSLGGMVWPVLTLILNQKMGYSATEVALIMIIGNVAVLPTSLLGGKLADHYNKKQIIVVCDLISVCSYILCGILPLSIWTIGLMIVASCCQTMEYPAYNALIADLTRTEDRERAYSLQYLGSNLGLVASPTIAGILFKNYLWLAFLISGIAIGISTVLIYFFVQDIEPVQEEESEAGAYQQSQHGASLMEVLRSNKVMLLYFAIMALFWGSYGQYNYLMPMEMARVHGENGAIIFGSVSSLNCIVVVIFTPLITGWFAKVTSTVKNLYGIALVFIGYLIFVIGLGYIPVYYLAILLFTWGEIFDTLVSGPYVTDRIPASHRGRINGVMSVLQSVVTSFIMYVVGVLYDQMGSLSAWGFVFGLTLLEVVGSILLIRLDRKHYPGLYE